MNYKQILSCLLTVTILLCALTNVRAQEDRKCRFAMESGFDRNHPHARCASIGDSLAVRSYAMMHSAMFDVINSIDGTYRPYLTKVPGSQQA